MPVRFVAKSDVSTWPFLGIITKLGKTIFVNRNLTNLKKETLEIKDRIRKGENVIIFPESTSTDGIRVSRFKSSLLGSIENEKTYIQI